MGAKTLSVQLNNHYSYLKVKFTSNTHTIREERLREHNNEEK